MQSLGRCLQKLKPNLISNISAEISVCLISVDIHNRFSVTADHYCLSVCKHDFCKKALFDFTESWVGR